jgi:hypothetical protein
MQTITVNNTTYSVKGDPISHGRAKLGYHWIGMGQVRKTESGLYTAVFSLLNAEYFTYPKTQRLMSHGIELHFHEIFSDMILGHTVLLSHEKINCGRYEGIPLVPGKDMPPLKGKKPVPKFLEDLLEVHKSDLRKPWPQTK